MKIRTGVFSSILAVSTFTGGVLVAQREPAENVGRRHPNLMEAQRLIEQAFDRIGAAQHANEWDMDGHAGKAKEFLDQADREIKLAAQSANHDRR